MITLHFIQSRADGSTVDHAVPGKPGDTLMHAAAVAGLDGIAADCGGLMTCATCHVYVREPWAAALKPPEGEELGFLDFVAAERRPNSRLSCQITLAESLDGLTVDLPATQY